MSTSDIQAMGLCATCNSIVTCTGRRNWCGPVLFCEEFEDHIELSPRPVETKAIAAAQASSSVDPRAKEHLGLCVNCDHREGCGLSTSEGGVWNCEEYE